MAKTTIDGLKVREPESNNRPAKPVRQSAHAIDVMRSASSAGKTARADSESQRKRALDSIDMIRQKSSAASSFLDPVETFNFDSEPEAADEEFATGVEADWSDLVNDTAAEAPAKDTAEENDFLSDWGESEDDDFLTKNALIDEDEEEEPEAKPARKERKKQKKHHWGRVIALSMLCLVVIAGGVFYKWGDELISRLTNGNSGLFDAIHSMISDEVPFATDSNGRTNVLVFGTEGYNMNGDTAFGAHDGAQLTDSIMVVSLDQNTKDVALISLPRDLKVSRACSAGKVNEVFWCHNQDGTHEEAGARALMEQVGDVLGLDFQYYTHVNWASLIDIIDTLGGITVTLDENIADYGFTGAVAQAGVPMQVNGEQALGLARARHGTTGGDFTRGNTQQKIVAGIVDKVMQNGIGMTEAFNLVNILGDNLRSNFSTDNIKAGVRVLSGFNINNIRQIPLVDYETNTFYMTTANINDVSYVVPSAGERDYSKIREYVAEMLSSNPTAREHARISVYNGSVQYGVAGAERERLTNDGYEVINIGDTSMGGCTDQYCLYAANDNFPHTQLDLENKYSTTARSFDELPGDIVPGESDFIIIIGLGGSEA